MILITPRVVGLLGPKAKAFLDEICVPSTVACFELKEKHLPQLHQFACFELKEKHLPQLHQFVAEEGSSGEIACLMMDRLYLVARTHITTPVPILGQSSMEPLLNGVSEP